MTYAEFHNGMRVLLNIDQHDLVETIGREEATRYWPRFEREPHMTFIAMPPYMSAAIYERFVAKKDAG